MRRRLTIAMMAAGCGGKAAPPPDGSTAAATVRVVDPAGPREGIDVVFHDAAGAVTGHSKTDARGEVVGTVTPDAIVTVASIGDGTRALTSVLGVEAGDVLEIAIPWGARAARTVGTVAVSFPSGPAGTDNYQVIAGCATAASQAPTTLTLAISEPCAVGGRVAILALATAGGGVIGYAVADADAAGTPTLVALPAWRTDLITLDVATTSPAGAEVFVATRLDQGATSWFAGGGMPPALSVSRPAAFGDSAVVHGFVRWTEVPAFASVASRTAPIPGAFQLDVASETLPRVRDLVVDSSDLASPVITWRYDGDPTTADGAVASLRWDDEGDDPLVWNFVAPPGPSPAVTVPRLPDALALWRPTSPDPSSLTADVFERDSFAGYATVRAAPNLLLDSLPHAGEAHVRTSFGSVDP